MRAIAHTAGPYILGGSGLALLTAAVLLAVDVYASPAFALSSTFLRLCGL